MSIDKDKVIPQRRVKLKRKTMKEKKIQNFRINPEDLIQRSLRIRERILTGNSMRTISYKALHFLL